MKHFSKIAIALFCVTVLLMQSCKKETDGPFRLFATIERYKQDNKVHIETDNVGSFTCWDVGDQVTINGILSEVCQDNDGYYIETRGGNYSDLGGHQEFAALYPTSLFLAGGGDYHGTTTVNLFQTQDYINGSNGTQKIYAPMIAYMDAGGLPPDNAHTMQFINVCALIKVNITNTSGSPVGINRIEIVNSADHPFWGRFNANVSASEQSITENAQYPDIASKIITKKATLNVNGQTIETGANNSKSFYIYVPAVAYSNLVMTVFTTDNRYRTYTGTVTGTFQPNTIYSKSITYDGSTNWKTISNPTGDIGEFTVSAMRNSETGITTYKKVSFAHGNLLPDGTIFTNQYDYKGWYGNNTDRFSSLPLSLPSGYSLLTSEEGNYLLTNENRGSARFVQAMVNYIPGMILFPDGSSISSYILTIGETSFPGMRFNGNNDNTSSPSYNAFNLEEWSILEAAGCVFLPRINWSGVNTITLAFHYWNQNGTTVYSGGVWVINCNYPVPSSGAYIRLVKEITTTE